MRGMVIHMEESFAANKMIGAATLDRLRHGAYRVALDGESYRDPKKPMPERSKPPAGKGGKPAHLKSARQ